MKKLLSLISTITVIGGSTSAVIACGTSTTKPIKPSSDIVNKGTEITSKIKQTNITVPAGTNPDVTNPQTVTALNTALQTANPNLKASDLNALNYKGGPLVAGQAVKVIVTATVDGRVSPPKQLMVTLTKPQNPAQAVIDKITNKNISVPAGTNPDVTNPQTIKALNAALKKADDLSDVELSELSYSGGPLVGGKAVQIKVTATVGSATASTDLSVTLEQSANPAQKIIDEIYDHNFKVPVGTNPSVTNPQTVTALNKALQDANPKLSADDLSKLSYSKGPLIAGQSTNITVTATVGSARASTDLDVTLPQAPNPAQEIINKISDTYLEVPNNIASSNITVQAAQDAIKAVLLSNNPDLTSGDLDEIMITPAQDGALLKVGDTLNVQIVATFSGVKAVKQATVLQQETPANILSKVTSGTTITLPRGTDANTSAKSTTAAIKVALEAELPSLTP